MSARPAVPAPAAAAAASTSSGPLPVGGRGGPRRGALGQAMRRAEEQGGRAEGLQLRQRARAGSSGQEVIGRPTQAQRRRLGREGGSAIPGSQPALIPTRHFPVIPCPSLAPAACTSDNGRKSQEEGGDDTSENLPPGGLVLPEWRARSWD
jgi:hypothetical protein